MAETTGIITTKEDQVVENWLTQVSAAQDVWFSALNADNQLRIAFAEANAKKLLMQTLTGENSKQIAAHLLAFSDVGMVEIIGSPSQAEIVKITAMAILTGFAPGQEEFSVYNTKQGTHLYVKENGYYKLFSKLKGASVPTVNHGYPELTTLPNGSMVWLFAGTASVEINKQRYSHTCEGDYRIGIKAAESKTEAGKSTDNIAGISTKARRAFLQLLWKKVRCAANIDDHDETVQLVESQPVVQPARIEAPPAPAADPWAAEWKRFPEDHPARKLARKMREADPESLDAHMIEADQLIGDKLIDKRAHESLSRYFQHLKGVTA